jgi:hypothetical protein
MTMAIETTGPKPPHAKALEDHLLGLGGKRVILQPEPEGFLPKLLHRGKVFPGRGVKRIAGGPSRCHGNSMILYLQFHNDQMLYESCEIATGYALSGGIWVQHSWLLADDQVIETTVRRTMYFGVVLNDIEAAQFVMIEVATLLPGWEEWHKGLAA